MKLDSYGYTGRLIYTYIIRLNVTDMWLFSAENILCVACPDFVLVRVIAGVGARSRGAARDHMETKF